ncbi:Uncharacterized protein OBRU01_10853 [Operophtera brumata]|uniref:DUF4817 domain-containing protein n=1 Tax=Operophtera brumata TaxID=104452 RepID=A0A0L7LDB9_OPEBR|nr:Uncharacterized protein OBRU01_10853 [Operophtera brumata]
MMPNMAHIGQTASASQERGHGGGTTGSSFMQFSRQLHLAFVRGKFASLVNLPTMYSNAEYYDMMLCVGGASNNSLVAAREMYRVRHPGRTVPSYGCFLAMVNRLHSTGSFHRRTSEGRPISLNPQVERSILDHFEEDPRRSTRRAALVLDVPSHMTVWRTLNKDGQHPYHYRRTQELLRADYGPRHSFCQWYAERVSTDPAFPNKVLWSDEATFTRNGLSNLHNDHVWAHENPHASTQSSFQHRWKRGGRKGPRSPPVVAVGSTPVSSSGTTTTPGTLHILAIQPPRAEIMVVPGFRNPFSLRAASSQPFHRVSLTATLTRRAYKQQNGEDVTTGPPGCHRNAPSKSSGNLTHHRNTTLFNK